jgi:hypothetical protein
MQWWQEGMIESGAMSSNAPATLKSRLLQTARQIGWVDAFWYALSVLLPAVSGRRWTLFKYRITAQPVASDSLCRGRGKAIEVRPVPDADRQADLFGRPAAVLAGRYAQQAQCLGAYKQDKLCGYLWFTLGPYQEDEVRARFVPASRDAAWDFDVQVFPEYQFGLSFPRLWDEANTVMRAHGVQWSCSRISSFNAASRAAHERLGAIKLGTAVFICCGSWQWTLSSMAPYLHLSRSRASYPSFTLAPSARDPLTRPA